MHAKPTKMNQNQEMQKCKRALTHPSPELLPSTNGLDLLEMQLLNLFASGIEIGLDSLDKRLTEHKFVTSVERGEQEQRNVRDEEIAGVPWHKRRESLGQDDQNVEEDPVP